MIDTVYLAGKMTGRLWSEVKAEREHATVLLNVVGIRVLDPIRGKNIPNDRILDGSNEGTVPDRCVVARDLADVRQADAIIVLTGTDNGFGTSCEWACARFLGKPVFVIIGERPVESLGMWRRELATAFFKDIEALVDHLSAFWR